MFCTISKVTDHTGLGGQWRILVIDDINDEIYHDTASSKLSAITRLTEFLGGYSNGISRG